jgi:Ras-related protein Rab-8A|eukprot:SAG25_NODE_81_length_16694_cov_8.663332_16_plen_174_part_00
MATLGTPSQPPSPAQVRGAEGQAGWAAATLPLPSSFWGLCAAVLEGILLVYDVTDRQSFTNVSKWVESIQQHGDEDSQLVLLGNKIDCTAERVVSTEEGRSLAAEYSCPFFEASAATGDNVELAFMSLAQQAYTYLASKGRGVDSAGESGEEEALDMGGGSGDGGGKSGACPC